MKKLLVIVCIIVLMACGCSAKPQRTVLGFMTISKDGIASHPFSTESEYAVVWKEAQPRWTALPIYVTGYLDGNTLKSATIEAYPYTMGTATRSDAYYNIVAGGYQEEFENLWCDVYDKLNGATEFSKIDGTVPLDIIEYVYDKDGYGNLRDIMTDAVAIIRDINETGRPTEELNLEASRVYNAFYAWLHDFSVGDLTKN